MNEYSKMRREFNQRMAVQAPIAVPSEVSTETKNLLARSIAQGLTHRLLASNRLDIYQVSQLESRLLSFADGDVDLLDVLIAEIERSPDMEPFSIIEHKNIEKYASQHNLSYTQAFTQLGAAS